MGKVTYIIPLHKFDEQVKEMLPNALKSIKDTRSKDYTLLIVGPKDVLDDAEKVVSELKMKTSTKFVENQGETDFFSQVNEAALKCTTKFFCVVEFDDTVIEYWPEVFGKYQAETSASVVMPLNELVEKLGLKDRLKHLPNQLSGGQQQRVSIGRALINHPALLLADEPTGNLDSKNSKEIVSLLRKFNREYNQTVIIITHDERIALSADRVITIEDGQITKDEVRHS